NVEQAFATYDLGNGAAITAGRYASMLGFEAFEPTGLYQYSVAYDVHDAGVFAKDDGFTQNDDNETSDATIIPRYAQGVKYTYETDSTFFGISLQDEVFDYDGDRLGGDDASGYGVEVAYSIAFGNGLSWFVGGAFEDSDEAPGDSHVINSYATFETGAWIFAAELNYGESEADRFFLDGDAGLDEDGEEETVFQALLMANCAYSEQASITGRISYGNHELEADGAGNDEEFEFWKWTLAHAYAFTDNLSLVTEISYVDGELDDDEGGVNFDYESLLGAVELIFSF
ncbi:MAG: outer membrane beta-barrel protein, partial [Opitutales bacterium]